MNIQISGSSPLITGCCMHHTSDKACQVVQICGSIGSHLRAVAIHYLYIILHLFAEAVRWQYMPDVWYPNNTDLCVQTRSDMFKRAQTHFTMGLLRWVASFPSLEPFEVPASPLATIVLPFRPTILTADCQSLQSWKNGQRWAADGAVPGFFSRSAVESLLALKD